MLIPTHNTVKVIIEKNKMYTQQAFVKIKGNEYPDVLKALLDLDYWIWYSTNWKFKEDCYVSTSLFRSSDDNYPAICTFSGTEPIWHMKNKNKCFDCKDNLKAFLKIIAMRDDTDMNQYFVDEECAEWVNLGMRIEPGTLEKCLTDKKVICFNTPKHHRASAQEIFDFFEKYKDSTL